jgi:hypothetical protein
MDYETRIKVLEEEMRHERALSELRGQRLDAHDASFNSIREILLHTAEIQEKFALDLAKLEVDLAELRVIVRDLVQAITAERSDGGPAK